MCFGLSWEGGGRRERGRERSRKKNVPAPCVSVLLLVLLRRVGRGRGGMRLLVDVSFGLVRRELLLGRLCQTRLLNVARAAAGHDGLLCLVLVYAWGVVRRVGIPGEDGRPLRCVSRGKWPMAWGGCLPRWFLKWSVTARWGGISGW